MRPEAQRVAVAPEARDSGYHLPPPRPPLPRGGILRHPSLRLLLDDPMPRPPSRGRRSRVVASARVGRYRCDLVVSASVAHDVPLRIFS